MPAIMERRNFLKSAIALGAPAILGAQDKSGNKLPVLGTGNHTYEVHHDWGELPASIAYGNTHGVVEDSQGHIYIHHTVNAVSESHDSMVVFDAKGKFVKSWGKEFKGGAHGLHIRKEGSTEYLYLCDTARGVIVKATLDGETVWSVGYPEQSEAYKPNADGKRPKWSPTNLAIAPDGTIYVGDGYGSSYILVYNAKGELQKTFGGKGKEAGKLDCPHGIIVDTRGKTPILTVADRGNARIQRFTLAGEHLDFVDGTTLPCHFNYFKNGDTVIPDLGAKVTLMDKDNKVIEYLGDDSASKWRDTRKLSRDHFTPGKFVAPHGACFDHAGNIFVVEWVEVGRVTKLQKV
jgi:DNA-binding beta-propeller fold protein YncE